MTVLRCTLALLKEIGQRPADLPAGVETTSPYGDWYINMMHIKRRKAIICVNAPTLLSFPMIGVTRAQLRDLPTLFLDGLRRTLRDEGWNDESIDALVREMGELTLGKTINRSVIGSMNELLFLTRMRALDILESSDTDGRVPPDGLSPSDLHDIASHNNRTPMRAAMGSWPIDNWHELGRLHCAVPPLDAIRHRALAWLANRLDVRWMTSPDVRYGDYIPYPFESFESFRDAALPYGLACDPPDEQAGAPDGERSIRVNRFSSPRGPLLVREPW